MPSEQPVILMIAGPDGSGKTTLADVLIKIDAFDHDALVNPDNIAKTVFGDWNDPNAIIKAAEMAEKIRSERLEARKDVVFETVLSMPDKLEYLRQAKRSGYFVHMVFVATISPVINAGRVAGRVMAGGHDVPIPKIIARYHRSIVNTSIAAKLVDKAHFYDNSNENGSPVLVFSTTDGQYDFVSEDVPEWAQCIVNELHPSNSADQRQYHRLWMK